jgi:hypothetical protein
VGSAASGVTQRARATVENDVMLRAVAFCPVPKLIVVELGSVELHVYDGCATWYLLSGRRLLRAAWGRC